MHVQILYILLVWLLVVVSTEPSKAFVAEVGFYWVDTSDQNVQSAVELLFVQYQWIVDVSLNQELVVEGRLWQISEFLEQDDPISASAF